MKALAVINKCKKDIKGRLSKKANGEPLIFAADILHRYTDQLLKQRLRESPAITFACQKGCDLCCHLRVEALPPEVLRIATHLNTLPVERRLAQIKQLEKHAEYAHEKTYRDYHAPCPFLGDGGACNIYPVRPRICRTHLSISRVACETPGNAQPDPALQQAENDLALQVIELYKKRAVCMNPAELGQAVLLALKDESAKARWLAGEEVFVHLPERIVL